MREIQSTKLSLQACSSFFLSLYPIMLQEPVNNIYTLRYVSKLHFNVLLWIMIVCTWRENYYYCLARDMKTFIAWLLPRTGGGNCLLSPLTTIESLLSPTFLNSALGTGVNQNIMDVPHSGKRYKCW